MKFSTTYIIYPDNKVLELALAKAIALLSPELAKDATPDTRIAVADNFLYTWVILNSTSSVPKFLMLRVRLLRNPWLRHR